jgi:hypothetical protein
MPDKPPQWEDLAPGVSALRLYRTELNPDWPRVVILDLSAEQFKEFEDDPLGFENKHRIYPEQPVQWTSSCQKPPGGKDIPKVAKDSQWRVVMVHGVKSVLSCAACNYEPPRTESP